MQDPAEDETFEALADREREGLYRFLYWSLGDRDDALDALQDTLVRGLRGFDAVRDRSTARNWLYVVASNVAKRMKSRRRRRPRPLGEAPPETAVPRLHGGAAPEPSAELEAADARERLAAALAALEPELREPLLLFAVSGLKYREIAETLGWPIGTVTTRIHVARQRLAAELRRGR